MISWRKHYKKGLIAIGLLLSTSAYVYAQGDPVKGQELFKANCTACHALDNVYIAKLRKLLKDDEGLEIINVHGEGFRLLVKN